MTERSFRVVLLGLTLACAFVAIYGSFVPLDLRSVPIRDAIRQFVTMPLVPLATASKSDLVTNVLLFVPIGFFGLGALSGRSLSMARALLVPIVCATTVLSVGIEFGQIFVHGRTPSWNDVVAQIVGSSLGVGLWLVVGRSLLAFVASTPRTGDTSDRFLPALAGLTCLWIIAGLLPFDFTVRLEELAQKVRAGGVTLKPFSNRAALGTAGVTLLLAVPAGAFFVSAARRFGTNRPASVGLAVGIATALALALAQLLSVSRPADITDVIVNAAGLSVGVWLVARRSARSSLDSRATPRVRLWPILAVLCWAILLVGRHWSPFDFVVDGAFARSRLPQLLRLPFYGYYGGFALAVLLDVTTKLLMAIPIGALLQMTWRPMSSGQRRLVATGIVVVAGALFMGIELGQLLLPSRVPDQTDIYVGTAGAAIGVWLVLRFDTVRASSSAADAE